MPTELWLLIGATTKKQKYAANMCQIKIIMSPWLSMDGIKRSTFGHALMVQRIYFHVPVTQSDSNPS